MVSRVRAGENVRCARHESVLTARETSGRGVLAARNRSCRSARQGIKDNVSSHERSDPFVRPTVRSVMTAFCSLSSSSTGCSGLLGMSCRRSFSVGFWEVVRSSRSSFLDVVCRVVVDVCILNVRSDGTVLWCTTLRCLWRWPYWWPCVWTRSIEDSGLFWLYGHWRFVLLLCLSSPDQLWTVPMRRWRRLGSGVCKFSWWTILIWSEFWWTVCSRRGRVWLGRPLIFVSSTSRGFENVVSRRLLLPGIWWFSSTVFPPL